MNDLAEKALHGLDAARRHVSARPMLSLGVAGFAVAWLVVAAGGQVGAARSTSPLTIWLGLQDPHRARAEDRLPGSLMLGGVVVLLGLWLLTVEVVRRTEQPERRVWWVAGSWATPFALGPPLMDTTAYSYVAFGLLQRHGHDPYAGGPSRLGSQAIVSAVDPGTRGTPSSVGPVGTLVQHLAVSISDGSALGAVVVLRVLAVLAAVAIGRLAADLSGNRRSPAITLTALNPLLLLYVVSAGHLDGVMVALLLAALLAARQRRWPRALVLAGVAGSVSAQALVAVPAIVVVHWLGRRTATWRLLGRDVLVAAATVGVLGLVVSDGFGWGWTVSKQFSAHTPFSIASAVAKVISPIVRGASYDDLAAGARITTITAMVCTIGYLLITARRRALERTVGYSLLAMALLAPVLYPWYLLWGTLCLAPTADGNRQVAVLALCGAGCLLAPQGFGTTTTHVLTAVGLVLVAAATAAGLRRMSPPVPDPEPVTVAGSPAAPPVPGPR